MQRTTSQLAALAFLVGGFAAHASAAVTLTTSASTPTLGASDQYSLDTSATISGGNYPYNVSSYSDRTPGQVFITPNTSALYTLNAFSLKGSGESGSAPSLTWTLRVSAVTPGSPDPVHTAILTATGIDGSAVAENTTDWLTWSFSGTDAIALAGGTTYAIEVVNESSGYFGFAGSTQSVDPYANGYAYTPNTDFGNTNFDWGYDRAFVVSLSPVPEPSCIALAGAGLLAMWRRRRS